MKTIIRTMGLALTILVAIPLILGFGLSTAFTGEGPKEMTGFVEGKAITTIKTNMVKGGVKAQKSHGKKALGAIGDTVGNRFTFAFGATKGAKGKVRGQMFL